MEQRVTGRGQVACQTQVNFPNNCHHRCEKIDVLIYTILTSVATVLRKEKKKNQCLKLSDCM